MNHPRIIDYNFPLYLEKKYTDIFNLINGSINTNEVCISKQYQTLKGFNFTFFTKSAGWNNNLYSACISPNLDSGLLVESWIRGNETGPTCNKEYETLDIKKIKFIPTVAEWSERKDHNKWAVARKAKMICIGDINHMTTQFARDGEAICFKHGHLYNIFNNSILDLNRY